jgi:hypothetical protein
VTLPRAANTGAACPGLPAWCRGGAFVQAHGAGAGDDFAGGQIGAAVDDVDGRDLVGELAGLLGAHGAQVRFQRERVLHLARDLPLLGHLLGRQAHAVGNAHVFVALEDLGIERRLVAPMGTMLMDSAPPAIITSASPTRMRSAAIWMADTPEAQKRFTVTPPMGWSNASPRRCAPCSCPARLREGAADDGVLDRLGVQRGHLGHGGLERGHQQIVGTGVLEIAPPERPMGVRVAATM